MKVCALLHSGDQRNVLLLHCYNHIHSDVRPTHSCEMFWGIGPVDVQVYGEPTCQNWHPHH